MSRKNKNAAPAIEPTEPTTEVEATEKSARKSSRRLINGKKYPFNTVMADGPDDVSKGIVSVIGDNVESVKAYLTGFKALPVLETSGYVSYWGKQHGFSNAEAPQVLTPQGVAKMMAVLIERSAQIIIGGGDAAVEMQAALAGLRQYQDVALDDATQTAQATAAENALAELTKAYGGNVEAARAKLASLIQPKEELAEV